MLWAELSSQKIQLFLIETFKLKNSNLLTLIQNYAFNNLKLG